MTPPRKKNHLSQSGKASFYPASSKQSKCIAIAMIAKKCFLRREPLYILSQTPEVQTFIDKLLWTFDKSAFLPHSTDYETDELICIHTSDTIPERFSTVLNTTSHPLQLKENTIYHIFEITPLPEAQEKFTHYKKHGFTILDVATI